MVIDTKWDPRMLQVAALVASWSKDPSSKCGAVITDMQHRIVSTGYNGLPQGVPDDDAGKGDHPDHGGRREQHRVGCTRHVATNDKVKPPEPGHDADKGQRNGRHDDE